MRFVSDFRTYSTKSTNERIKIADLRPMLGERTSNQFFDAQYFYQAAWLYEKIRLRIPHRHVDVGGQLSMSGWLSVWCPVIYIDIREFNCDLPNFTFKQGSILNLPFDSRSVDSISCLHVAEHIGLGRYGDPLDPEGTLKACLELGRVLKEGGDLYFSVPIGVERVCFNANRIFNPHSIIFYFQELTLKEFSVIDDNGKFQRSVKMDDYTLSNSACGLFHFVKSN